MKKLFLLFLFISSFAFSIENEIKVKQEFFSVTAYTKDKDFIKEATRYRKGLSLQGVPVNRTYINYLYKKYPKYKKLIYINFDTTSKDLYPLSIKGNDLKINHSKYIITNQKKEDFLKLLTKYLFLTIFILLIILSIAFAFFKKEYFIYTRIILSIFIVVLLSIYYYMYNNLFHCFNNHFIDNLDNYILGVGVFISVVLYKIFKKEHFLSNGVVISVISYLIVSILSTLFI